MDPITIAVAAAGIAQHCIRISSMLYSFIRSGNNIDTTVTVLNNEVESLRRILEAISDSCRLPAITEVSLNEDQRAHWSNLRETMVDCETTLETLETRILSVRSNRATLGHRFGKYISKRIKWESISQELFLLRQQVSAYRETMGLSLQWITL
jgi:hypothetical protein